RTLTNKKTTSFGKEKERGQKAKDRRSAPSYIPAETFATTLLARLNLSTLTQKLSIVKLIDFKDQEILAEINKLIKQLTVSDETHQKLTNEVRYLEKNLENIFISYRENKTTLLNSINRIGITLDKYIEASKAHFTDAEEKSKQQFLDGMATLKQDTFIEANNPSEFLVKRLQPGLTEIIDLLEKGGAVYREAHATSLDSNSEIYKAYQDIETEIQTVIGKLPLSVRESLAALAQRAQIKSNTVEEELNHFKTEIEVWFDRSMDRASGVYKRNAKGVAFLIGCVIAYAANADTLHIIGRLSKDTPLRNAITQNASQVASDPKSCQNFESQEQSTGQRSSKLECIRNQVNESLDPLILPIGRSPENLKQQEQESQGWQIKANGWQLSFSPLRRFIGWMISGLAISMGAPFWFELLGKIMNVRNTGPKPASSTKKQTPDN
ncbi:MAG TPA: hypothetical protein DCP31_29385, partial [Cyanobacteria bacterium UBA8543]|nr:hypothetical protein [Cyanobacteria bacterium UBA8543]